MSNLNLAQAKKAKNDEFYTPIEAIEAEVPKYRQSLTGKIVYCNCDNPKRSQFWKYLYRNFTFLQLKELISTHYNADGVSSYALIYRGGSDSAPNCDEGVERINLKESGDFRSDECIEFLRRSNIVITNPPFSLAKYLIKLLADYHKQFLIIGNKNLFNCKTTFPLIMQHKIWTGTTDVKYFYRPDGLIKKFGNITWLTNLPVVKTTDQTIISSSFCSASHPAYDNYPAFEVSKLSELPTDLEIEANIDSDNLQGWISQYQDDLSVLSNNGVTTHIRVKRPIYGVPITFLDKYNPSALITKHNLSKEFDILGMSRGITWDNINRINTVKRYQNVKQVTGNKIVNGSKINTSVTIIDNDATSTYYTADNAKGKIVSKYARIFIRVKPDVTEF